ncbi:hypothetical protein N9C85_01600 [Synechococcus sp. AH-224-I15]|nr:hypothetical protein [Synechococcus sp. AH-224-I15]
MAHEVRVEGPPELVPLTAEERESLTLRGLREARLKAYENGELKGSAKLIDLPRFLKLGDTTVRGYESGRTVPRMTLPKLVAMAGKYGVTVEELNICWENTQNQKETELLKKLQASG